MARSIKVVAGLVLTALLASPAFAQLGAFGDVLRNVMAEGGSTKPSSSQPAPKVSLLGEWMNEGQSCIAPSVDGEYVEGANLRIESGSIHGFEWGCDLKPAIADGATSYQGEQSCYGDVSDDAPSPIVLTLRADGRLQMQDASGTQTLFRCN